MFEPLDPAKCCGCAACADACPKGIIDMQPDALGFYTPMLTNVAACVSCERCKAVCPGRAHYEREANVGGVYAAYDKDYERRGEASSGGVFGVLARCVLRNGGVVYGAAFDKEFLVRHECVRVEGDLWRIQGSKYLQSNTQHVFARVRRDVQKNREVLFSGTPCQADALRLFLADVDCSRLLVVDLFCYGVPSPRVWQEWFLHLRGSERHAERVSFRDKAKGWQHYSLRVEYSDGTTYIRDKAEDLYLQTFSKGAYLRESCYHCTHKLFPHGGDLSLGDFQEIDEVRPSFNNPRGVSMVRVNTARGEAALARVESELELLRVPAHIMDTVHPGMGAHVVRDARRDRVVANIGRMPIGRLLARYGKESLSTRAKKSVKALVKGVLR